MDIQEQRIWEVKYRVAVQPKLDEPVLAAALFRRPGGFGALFSKLAGKPGVSKFPETFVVAITPTRMHAFAAHRNGDEIGVHEEVAAWERSAVEVTVSESAVRTVVTIATPGDPEKVVWSTGKDDLSRSVVRFMADPAVVAA
jgi:hypothetical protein